jgi:diguanylate cyclase (GGDEF)-like protein
VVARIGGDEFVLLVQRVKRADVPPLADSLIETVSQPFDLGHANSIRISASIGVALVPDHGEDIDTILKAADGALYAAKARGKTCWALAAPAAHA